MIRPAVVADAAAIARIQCEGWHHAYRGIMPEDVLDALDVEERRRQWHDRLADGAEVHVDDEEDVRGFVAIGPTRDRDRMGCGEVFALYVDQRWQGGGRGAALLRHARLALGPDAVLWVLRDNTPARRFYESQGWVFDGTEKVSQWGPVESRYEYRASA